MYVALFVLIPIVSLAMAWYFVSRDAKKFAQAPPAPLIDLDTMYDKIYSNLDEETGAAITPQELQNTLAAFVDVLLKKGIVAEDIKSGDVHDKDELSPESIAAQIRKDNPNLGVAHLALVRIIEASLTYLKGINALT